MAKRSAAQRMKIAQWKESANRNSVYKVGRIVMGFVIRKPGAYWALSWYPTKLDAGNYDCRQMAKLAVEDAVGGESKE